MWWWPLSAVLTGPECPIVLFSYLFHHSQVLGYTYCTYTIPYLVGHMMATVHTGSNDREHPNSSPIGSPRPPHSPMPHSPMPHSPMPHSPMPHSPMPHSPMPHSPMPYSSMPHSPMPHSPMPHSSMPHSPMPYVSCTLYYISPQCSTHFIQASCIL